MQCLVLAGGLGTRMQHLSQGKPKALLPCGDQTFIEFQLRWLRLLGVSHAILCLGFKSEEIESQIQNSRFKDLFPKISYSYDGKELVGTGGAIVKAKDLLDENFFVTYGDTVLFLDLHKMHHKHVDSQKAMTMALLKNKNVGDKSNAKLTPNGPYYDKIHPDPEMEYIDYGILELNRDKFIKVSPDGKFDLAQTMNQFCKEQNSEAYIVSEIFQEIGSPAGYERFENFLKQFNGDLEKIYQLKVAKLS